MPLTDTSVKNAKPKAKQYKLFDERGLFLIVTPNGGKWWRFRYKLDDKEKLLSLGVYPDVGLKAARKLRDDARELLAQDIDPSINRKVQKSAKQERAANSFEVIAREWCAKNVHTWAASTGDKTIRRFERDIFPFIGGRPIADITSMELLVTMQRIEKRGAVETAHRALANCGQVFRHAIATGRATYDPVPPLRGALTPAIEGHFPAVTEPKQVAELLRTLDGYTGTFIVKCALSLAPLVFVRPSELRKALWADIDLDNAEWRYHVTKTKSDHIVPLATQAVTTLRELHALTGQGAYVFPSARGNARPMSDNAILGAMRRMGIPKDEMTGHGFRAMARTILDEVLGVRPDLIEHQLAHAVRDPLGRAYNRTSHLPERRKMMQQWADYLDKLKAGAEVIPLHSNLA
ncbi:tyrosine-type recombinase/integrase [Sulfuriferula nivalis]|uniref:Integrase n=1 Tax=Sulfuriferula nivalis TaxID=2675298 RepID=A0A809SAA3_9PROT|nr:integrase arm-type DNA-binding domain-containing protein [Sulfuriferula nivalis]BBP01462.1 integrase [Sulfuriferula nivalis]